MKALNPPVTPAEPYSQPQECTLPCAVPTYRDHHEPDNTQSACDCELQCIGEDISEKLDYTPDVFTVEQHGARTGSTLSVKS